MEHTPKNTLIKGIKEKVEVSQIEKKYNEYKEFMEYLGINPLLHELLSPYYLVKE